MLKSLNLWYLHHWEFDSKRRIARAIEKKINPIFHATSQCPFSHAFLSRIYYTQVDRNHLKSKIENRLDSRLKEGLISEVESLLNRKICFERLERYGLEYKWVTRYLRKTISYDEMFQKLATDIRRYAKRQMTFIRYLQKQGHFLTPITDKSAFFLEVQRWLNDEAPQQTHPL